MSTNAPAPEPQKAQPIRSSFDLDHWLFELVSERHPNWLRADGSCPECWEEVSRMLDQAELLEVD